MLTEKFRPSNGRDLCNQWIIDGQPAGLGQVSANVDINAGVASPQDIFVRPGVEGDGDEYQN